jgi:hypothetical protein
MLFPYLSNGQENNTLVRRKLSLGFSFSFDYSYRTLTANTADHKLIDIRDEIESPKFGYTTGLRLCTDFYKNFTFEMGLLFADKGEKEKKKNVITPQPGQTLPTAIETFYDYYYIDVPFKVNYYFNKSERRGFFVFAGISPNIFLNQKTTIILDYPDGHQEEKSADRNDYSRINLSITAGAGYHWVYSGKLFFKIQPTFRHSITSIIDAPINGFLYSLGLDLGVYFKS